VEKLIDICDKSLTFSEFPGDCNKFKHCVYKDGVYQYVVKSCNPPKLFNPKTQSCDAPEVVKAIKPACDVVSAPITQKPILGGIVTTTTAKPWKPVVYPDGDIDFANDQPCDPNAAPHVEYPGDCHKFKHCMPQQDGTYKYAIKNCGDSMMYNPISMVCDWPAAVIAIKPECGQPGTSRPDRVYPDLDIDEARENGVCKPSDKLTEYRGDCDKYYECASTPTGQFQYVIKTCGPTMMFNPKTKVSDLGDAEI